ncbi:MAG TPA: DUF192 domain-containing protein [Candidatus Paceibacterota bacterium]|nr:DUF192 domain-containing protein [Candidatus Paceibacterota bacterium]
MFTILLVVIVAGITVLAAFFVIVLRPNPPLKSGTLTVAGPELKVDGAVFNVEIASTTLELTRGLSYRASLGTNDSMLFLFGKPGIQNFWMIGMKFPLDMIWIGGDIVLGAAENVPAPASGTAIWQLPIYNSPDGTDKVLEVNAGTVAKYGIKAGDTVAISGE